MHLPLGCCNAHTEIPSQFQVVQVYVFCFHHFLFFLLQKLETELKESEPELSKLKETAEEVKAQVSQHDAGLVKEHIR